MRYPYTKTEKSKKKAHNAFLCGVLRFLNGIRFVSGTSLADIQSRYDVLFAPNTSPATRQTLTVLHKQLVLRTVVEAKAIRHVVVNYA